MIDTPPATPVAVDTPSPSPLLAVPILATPAPHSPAPTPVPAPPPFSHHPFPNGASDPDWIVTGSDGNLWTVEVNHDAVARATPSGAITEFHLAGRRSPMHIVAGPDGNLWFSESATGAIGRITTAGAITEFPVPGGASGSLTLGPDGALWFGERSGIGRISVQGTVTEFALTTGPYSLTTGSDGALWFTEALFAPGTPGPHEGVGRITTAGVATHYELPHPPMFAGDIVAGPDGDLWVGEQGMLVRMTTQGTATEVRLSGGQQITPTGMILGRDGNLWLPGASSGPSLLRITQGGAVQVLPVTGMGPGPEPHVYSVGLGPDGHIWALGGFGVQAPSGQPDQLIRVN